MGVKNLEFFHKGKHYDLIHKDVINDINFWLNQAHKYVDSTEGILELACGTGRITIPLAEAGNSVTGIDISSDMLQVAREKSKELDLHINWIEGDMRNFKLNQKFDLLILPFNSMCYLKTLDELENLFCCVREHLSSNGKFIIDVFNPNLDILRRSSNQKYLIAEYRDEEDRKISVSENNVYDNATQVNRITNFYKVQGNFETKVYTENLDLRMFYPQELDAILKYNSFSIVQKFGDFKGNEFNSESPKQILVLEKNKK